jgi:hypothetical protein
MHGQLPSNLDEKLVGTEQTHRWLKSGDTKGGTGTKIVAAWDQTISTNYCKSKMLKEETDSRYRLYKQHVETTDHLTSGCPILEKNEYLMRQEKFVHICFTQHAKF